MQAIVQSSSSPSADSLDDVLDPEVDAIIGKLRLRAAERGRPLTLRAWLEEAEAWMILDAIEKAGGNHTRAARALGIGRRTIYTRKKRLGIGGDAEPRLQIAGARARRRARKRRARAGASETPPERE